MGPGLSAQLDYLSSSVSSMVSNTSRVYACVAVHDPTCSVYLMVL
uniref:Uncharacterized protein n=1 Tax=Anguilla anguilla TaxID=7936 RepID=A0A0E9SN17_ANGAN